MAFEPQRFIHAANVRLDVPVSVQSSETLTDELRIAFEDATLTSFDDVIQSCLAHRVDFLLLSGNIFIEADRSLRARLALLNGFEALAAEGIPVYVLPGDADPPEAWRAIPELPENVHICFSSNPEPLEVVRDDRTIATVSASMWYGETDSFGIRVIAETEGGVQPFRIASVSQAKYEESQRMAAMAAESTDDLLDSTLQNSALAEQLAAQQKTHGTLVPLSGKPRRRKPRRNLDEISDGDADLLAETGNDKDSASVAQAEHEADEDSEFNDGAEWEAGFVEFVDETLREGRLNFLALTGELQRTTLQRPLGTVHCPGTTQPRNHLETTEGCCSLVEITEQGLQRIRAIDTSSVDWKDIEVRVASNTTLSTMLQIMKTRLMQQDVGSSDRIWSVHWTLRCSIPVLKELLQEDLAVAVAVELDELKRGTRIIRLLHNLRLVPNDWQLPDEKHLAQRYSAIINHEDQLQETALQKMIDEDSDLTVGWRHRLNALISGLETEQILARMRVDGADWFIPDLTELTDAVQSVDHQQDGQENYASDVYGDDEYADDGAEEDDQADDEFSDDDAVDVLMNSEQDEDDSLYDDDQYDSESDEDSDDEESQDVAGGAA